MKIDKLILSSNSNNDKRQQDKYNEIISLISYIHCLDLYDFLENYSKVQKNELLFQISLTYSFLGYNKFSLDYINKSLIIIPNVPTIILFKSCLFASMNKFDDAQKCLLKYKYLIGEDIFPNYIYNIVKLIFYYILDYEENLILKEINIIETKNQKYNYNKVILFYFKSKLFNKLSERLKQIDKNRSDLYRNDSILNKEKAFNCEKLDADYLFKFDIYKENIPKIITMIYPKFLEYRPKPLIEYNNNFHCGFRLFYILFKICKIFKLKIQLIKNKKISNNKHDNKNLYSSFLFNDISSKKILYPIENTNNLDNNKENQNIKINNKNDNRKGNLSKSLNNNINDKLKNNYYIYKDFYSNMNLKEYIVNNINRNKEYKETKLYKDFFLMKQLKIIMII